MEVTLKFSEVLKEELRKNDLYQVKVCRDLKIHPATFNGWLAGVKPTNLIQLKKLADYFGVTVDYLLFKI